MSEYKKSKLYEIKISTYYLRGKGLGLLSYSASTETSIEESE